MDYIKHDVLDSELRLEFVKSDLLFSTTSFLLEYIEKKINAKAPERVVLDMKNVSNIDSSAVGMFIALKNKADKTGKKLVFKDVSNNVFRIFNILNIAGFLGLKAA